MKIDISKDALNFIKNALINTNKLPKIELQKGGCSGNMFVLKLSEKSETDKTLTIDGLQIIISEEVLSQSTHVSIVSNSSLNSDILVINKSAKSTCKCKKSFIAS